MSQSFTQNYRVLQSITEYYRVFQSITKTNIAHLLGPIFGLVYFNFDYMNLTIIFISLGRSSGDSELDRKVGLDASQTHSL